MQKKRTMHIKFSTLLGSQSQSNQYPPPPSNQYHKFLLALIKKETVATNRLNVFYANVCKLQCCDCESAQELLQCFEYFQDQQMVLLNLYPLLTDKQNFDRLIAPLSSEQQSKILQLVGLSKPETPSVQPSSTGPKIQSKEDKNDSDDDANSCVVCFDNPVEVVLLECGHLCLCSECSQKMNMCPVCRGSISRVVKVYKV